MATTLDWYGCATFAMRTGGLTVFLDAYVDRAPGAAGTQVVADDITECDWIVVGHAHFDHLYGAERIARNTGARIIGSYETVRVMEQAGVPVEQMICVAGGETVALSDSVRVSVFPSQHSCVWSHRQMSQADEVCIGDLGLTWQEQRARFGELIEHFGSALSAPALEHLMAANQGDRGDGGALVYVFDTPDGQLLFQDTSGHWTGILGELRPDVAIVAAAGRGNVDGEPIQGSLAEFVGREVSLLDPAGWCCATTTTGCPDSRWTPTSPRSATSWRGSRRATELVELGYLDATPVLP